MKLEELARKIFEDIKAKKNPSIEIPINTRGNVVFDTTLQRLKLLDKKGTRSFKDLSQTQAFARTMSVLKTLVESKRENIPITKRDLFYSNKIPISDENQRLRFDDQSECDNILVDIELITENLMEDMGVIAEDRGVISGDIAFESEGDIIDCSKMGKFLVSIPSTIGEAKIVRCNAKFVLVVEKGTVISKLNTLKWWKKANCILISGGGQADRATRRLVKRLHEELGLPVFILVDCDPYGWYIASVYQYGSMKLAFDSERLACPDAKFLGISLTDLETFQIPKACLTPLTEKDIKRGKDLTEYEWFKTPFWENELKLLAKRKHKAEIEILSRRGLKFLTETYLPTKLKEVAGIAV